MPTPDPLHSCTRHTPTPRHPDTTPPPEEAPGSDADDPVAHTPGMDMNRDQIERRGALSAAITLCCQFPEITGVLPGGKVGCGELMDMAEYIRTGARGLPELPGLPEPLDFPKHGDSEDYRTMSNTELLEIVRKRNAAE